MTRAFASLLLLSIAATAAPVAEIPFRFNDGFICIEARLPGTAQPLNLLVDSGAGVSVLSLRTARQLKLRLGAAQSVHGVGSEAAAYRLDPILARAAGVALPPFALGVDLSMADELCGRRVDGLVGVDFFKDRIVQIDYAHHRLRLIESGAPLAAGEQLPLKVQNGILCVPVGVNDSKPRWTRFDTGCNDALHWVVPRPQENPPRQGVTIGFITNPDDSALTSVSLGAHSMSQVKTTLHGRELFPGEAGLLGNGLLSRFTVTVDWPNRRVVLGE